MQIREQGETIKLIRTERTPGAVRARQKVIGAFRRDRGPTGALLDQLTDDELAEFDRWMSVRRDRHERARHRQTLYATYSRLTEIVAAIHESAELLSPAEAATIWRDLAYVARALTRSGYARPKRPRKPPAPLPGQGDLLDSHG